MLTSDGRALAERSREQFLDRAAAIVLQGARSGAGEVRMLDHRRGVLMMDLVPDVAVPPEPGVLALIEDVIGGRRQSAARRDSILALSALIGAVAMARSVDDDQLSRDILSCTAEALKSLVARS